MPWKIIFTKRAQDDAMKLKSCGLKDKAQALLDIIQENPYKTPPPFEKLIGVEDTYSRRINIRHRLVYEIRKKDSLIVVKMLFKHLR